jgi:hypothetical protein
VLAAKIFQGNMSNTDQNVQLASAHANDIAAWAPMMIERLLTLPPQYSGSAMERYIREQNLSHYRKVLSETTDPTKRETLLKLLADEQANAGSIPITNVLETRQLG